ncbi:hypothetical protein KFL_000140350 [Klebsormidium nitens]|uniref:Uncharacterized protein n=1 Tax=Klebsormidium nitens TaxID=105231 RepID=A0A1Y1HJ30_KLENI|nr:hypothetical protein KFL_000140350 [Klebsormidium nitens]|eukprot:GAQ78515.1 hypothetical protein KFL_000140350 [Klebsormidium nitens]
MLLVGHPGVISKVLNCSACETRRKCWSSWLLKDRAEALRFRGWHLARLSGGGFQQRQDRSDVLRCSIPAEGKNRKGGTQRIGSETRGGKKRKKHRESGGVNGEGGTVVTSALRQLPLDLTLQQENGSALGAKQGGGTKPSESATEDGGPQALNGKFGKWLYPAIAGLAVAGVAWVAAPQALELLAASNHQTKPSLGVEYEWTPGDGSVERILARELAKRFHEMPPDELATVLKSLMDARTLPSPDPMAHSEHPSLLGEKTEQVPRKAVETQESPARLVRGPQTGPPEETVSGGLAGSSAQATVSSLNESKLGRERKGAGISGLRGTEPGGATEGSDAVAQGGGEEAGGRTSRSVVSGPGHVALDVTEIESQGRAPGSASPQVYLSGAAETETESVRPSGRGGKGASGGEETGQSGRVNEQTGGLRTEAVAEGERSALGGSGDGTSGQQSAVELGGDVAAEVSGRGSQEEVPPSNEEASDVTLERLRAAGVDVSALFSSEGGGAGVETMGGIAVGSGPGDPLGVGGLAGALVEKVRGLRVDPDALFAPVREVIPTAEFEKALEGAREAVRSSGAVTGLENLRASVAENGLEGLTQEVAESWGKQGLPIQLGIGAAFLVVVASVVAALWGAWEGVTGQDGTASESLSEQGESWTGRKPSPNNVRQTGSGEPSTRSGEFVRDAAVTGGKEMRVDGAGYTSAGKGTGGGRAEERWLRSRPDVSRAAADVSEGAVASGGKVLWVRGEEPEVAALMERARRTATARASDRQRGIKVQGSRREVQVGERVGVQGLKETGMGEGREREVADVRRPDNGTEKQVGGLADLMRAEDGMEKQVGGVPAGANRRSQTTGPLFQERNARVLEGAVQPSSNGAVAPREKPLEAGGVTPEARELGSVTQLLSRRRPKRGGGGLELLSNRGRVLGNGHLSGEDGGSSFGVQSPSEGARHANGESAAVEKRRRSGVWGQKGASSRRTGESAEGQEREGVSLPGAMENGSRGGVAVWEGKREQMERNLGEGSGREAEYGVRNRGSGMREEGSASGELGKGFVSVDMYGASGGLGGGRRTGPPRQEERARDKERGVGERDFSEDVEFSLGQRRFKSGPHDLHRRRAREGPSRGLQFFERATKAERLGPRGSPSLAAASEGRRYLQPVVLGKDDGRLRLEGELHHSGGSAEHLVEEEGMSSVGASKVSEEKAARAEPLPRVRQAGEREAGKVIDRAVFTLESTGDGQTGRRYVRPTLEASREGGGRRGLEDDVALMSEISALEGREGPQFDSPPAEARMTSAGASVTSGGTRLAAADASAPAAPRRTAYSEMPRRAEHHSTVSSMVGREAVDNIGMEGVSASGFRQQFDPQTVAADKRGNSEHTEDDWREAFRHSRRVMRVDRDVLN